VNIFALFSLLSALVCLSLGWFVFHQGSGKALNRVGALFCVSAAWWAFTQFGYHQAGSLETARFWLKLGLLWQFTIPLLLHLVLIFTEKWKLLRGEFAYLLLYVPAAAFALLGLTAPLLLRDPVKTYWGWASDVPENTLAVVVSTAWAVGVSILAAFLCWRYYLGVTDDRRRQQAKYVVLGLSIPVVAGAISEGLFPYLAGIRIPELSVWSFLPGIAIVVYAIWKYELSTLTPVTAAGSITSTMSDALLLVSRDGEILRVNRALSELVGYDDGELVGEDVEMVFADKAYAGAGREVLTRTSSVSDLETALRTKGGRSIPVSLSASAVRGTGSGLLGVVYIGSDIGERERAEEELHHIKMFNEGIVRAVAEPLLIEDAAGTITFVNPALEDLLGYTGDELVGCPWQKIVPQREIRLVQAKTAERSAGVSDRYETRLLSKGGREIPVLVSARALFEEGAFTGVLSAFTDITERKRAEEERRQLEAQLRQAQKMEAVGLLTGGVAHEFNNLLTVMQGNAELGLAQVEPGHALHKELSVIQRTAKRAAKLTRQLLAFSRRQVLEPQILDLNRLVTDFSEMLGLIIGEDIEVQVKVAPELRTVFADANAVEQVLMNLALNARDAMPEGGTLTLKTAQVTLDGEYRRSHPDVKAGDYVRVTVVDTGVGMDEATQERLFEPFFTTKEPGKGTGLGLAMVYGIVKQHDGLIDVHSQLGEGTRFEVYFPVQEADV